MKILVINSGSSSLKYQLFDMTTGDVLAKGLCERIGGECGIITHKRPGHDPYKAEPVLPDHGAALSLVLGIITDKELWLTKLEEDKNSYWLARKTVKYLQTKVVQ